MGAYQSSVAMLKEIWLKESLERGLELGIDGENDPRSAGSSRGRGGGDREDGEGDEVRGQRVSQSRGLGTGSTDSYTSTRLAFVIL